MTVEALVPAAVSQLVRYGLSEAFRASGLGSLPDRPVEVTGSPVATAGPAVRVVLRSLRSDRMVSGRDAPGSRDKATLWTLTFRLEIDGAGLFGPELLAGVVLEFLGRTATLDGGIPHALEQVADMEVLAAFEGSHIGNHLSNVRIVRSKDDVDTIGSGPCLGFSVEVTAVVAPATRAGPPVRKR